MKLTIRILARYVLPLTILAVLSVYLITRSEDRLHYELPTLSLLEFSAVDRVDLKRGKTQVRLLRNENNWVIDGPDFAAEPAIIEGMIRTAGNLTLTDLIAREPTYARYGLDEAEAITATFRQGTRLLRTLKIGKRSPTYSHTYVMVGDDPRVFQAVGNLTNTFTAQEQLLRDRTVLTFAANEISEITATDANGAITLRRGLPPTAEAAPTSTSTSGAKFDSATISQILQRLASLKAVRFIQKPPDDVPLLKKELQSRAGTRHLLTIYPQTANVHAATSSDAQGAFVLLPVLLADVITTFVKDPA